MKTALGSFVRFALMHVEALVSTQVFLSPPFCLGLSPPWKEENSVIRVLAGSSRSGCLKVFLAAFCF